MSISLSDLTAVASGTALLLAIKRALEIQITLFSWRTTIFYKTRLRDLEDAISHVSPVRVDAYKSLIESRVFKFLFGFCPSIPIQNAIHHALKEGTLSESEVKILKGKIVLDQANLAVKVGKLDIVFAVIFLLLFFVAVATPIIFLHQINPQELVPVRTKIIFGCLLATLWTIGIKCLREFVEASEAFRVSKKLREFAKLKKSTRNSESSMSSYLTQTVG